MGHHQQSGGSKPDMNKPGMSKSDLNKGPQNRDHDDKQQRQGGGSGQQQGGNHESARLDDPERSRDPNRQDEMKRDRNQRR